MSNFVALLWKHRTKTLGFIQITLGALASVDGIFAPKTVKVLLLTSGVLTAWIGFINSAKLNEQNP